MTEQNTNLAATGPTEAGTPATPTTVAPTTPPPSIPAPPPLPDVTQLTAPASAPPAHRNWVLSLGHAIEAGVVDMAKFTHDLPAILKAWNMLEPQVKTVAVQVLHDVMVIVNDATKEVADVKSGDLFGAVALAPQTWDAIRQLITDAKAGEQGVVASLKALGVVVPPTATAS